MENQETWGLQAELNGPGKPRELVSWNLRFDQAISRNLSHRWWIWWVLTSVFYSSRIHSSGSCWLIGLPSGKLTWLCKITMFNGKIQYFDWVIFNSKLLVPQRKRLLMLTGRLGWWRLYPLVVGCVLQICLDMSDVPHESQKNPKKSLQRDR